MRARRRRNGQSMVEFALVFPIVSTLCFGIISSSYLFFQASALTNGSRNGARLAAVEFQTFDIADGGVQAEAACGGGYGENGNPTTIAAAAASAMPVVSVNPAILCDRSGGGTGLCPTAGSGGPLKFTQASAGSAAQATITMSLTCGSTSATYGKIVSVTVIVSRTIKGLAPPTNGSYTYTAQSQTPTLIGF